MPKCSAPWRAAALAPTSIQPEPYSTNFGGGVTVEISYIDPQPGGFVVGTFMGTVVGMTGESMNIAQGAFQMEIQ